MQPPVANPYKGGFPWHFGEHRFFGYSIAGVTTSLVYENLKLAFDIGQGLPFNIPCNDYFITHVHADHASGINYVLSQRSLWGLKPARFFVPKVHVEPLSQVLELWQKMEGFRYNFELQGVAPGDTIALDEHHYVRVFKTFHRIESQGYELFRVQKKLKSHLLNKTPQELVEIKKTSPDIHDHHHHGVFAFTGDTTIEFLASLKDPLDILFMETTFIDDKKNIASAREWGHVHLDEWAHRIEQIPAKKIVLIHFSARYSLDFIRQTLAQKIPKAFSDRIEIFPRPF